MTRLLARLPILCLVAFAAACGGSDDDIRTDDDPPRATTNDVAVDVQAASNAAGNAARPTR